MWDPQGARPPRQKAPSAGAHRTCCGPLGSGCHTAACPQTRVSGCLAVGQGIVPGCQGQSQAHRSPRGQVQMLRHPLHPHSFQETHCSCCQGPCLSPVVRAKPDPWGPHIHTNEDTGFPGPGHRLGLTAYGAEAP